MKVLVVEANYEKGVIWADHIRQRGHDVFVVYNQIQAILALQSKSYDVMVIDTSLADGSIMAILDFASYRRPKIAIIIVSDNGFFGDGALLDVIPNTRSLLHTQVRPEDLVALVDHCAPKVGRG